MQIAPIFSQLEQFFVRKRPQNSSFWIENSETFN